MSDKKCNVPSLCITSLLSLAHDADYVGEFLGINDELLGTAVLHETSQTIAGTRYPSSYAVADKLST